MYYRKRLFLHGYSFWTCYLNTMCLLREGFKVRKKKSVENSTLGSETPPLPPSVEKYNLFFLSFWHHSEQLWKKLFFPLEKTQKHLENFHKSFLVEG